MPLIYVVDDDPQNREIVMRYLEKEQYSVQGFSEADSALQKIRSELPDLVILDIMMPGMDGLDLCREIRKQTSLPIIFVSARGEETDRVLGLELGGDDYLSKPFSPREMVARVKSILRRANTAGYGTDSIHLKDLVLLTQARRAVCREKELELTAKEYDLLLFLAVNKGRAYTREQLLTQVWGYDFPGELRAIDDLVKRLRRKIKEAGSEANIATVWGYGYRAEA